jgi:hypothetical protein
MTRLTLLRWQLEVAALRHTLWALPGALAVLLALVAWVWWVPAQQAARDEALAALSAARVAPRPVTPVAPPRLPDVLEADEAVQRLVALAAEHGLHVVQADYRRQQSGRLGRWQLQIPAAGTYPQVRHFLRAAQTIPGLSLDELAIQRGNAGTVDARMLFSIWFSSAAPAREVS